MELKIFLLIASICCFAITHVSGYCSITLSQDESLRPKLYKNIGSRKALIHTEGLSYQFNENEVITADCETRVQSPSQFSGKRSIDCKCTTSYIQIDGTSLSKNLPVQCDKIKWNLYESSKQFSWCPTPMASYLLARPLNNIYEYLAGVCYNFDQQQILNIHYAAAYQLSKYQYPTRLQNYSPTVEILDIPNKFVARRIKPTNFKNVEIQEWMKFSQYENHSIIQDPNLYNKSYDKFGGFIELDWWPSLRTGNWRLYEKALREHIEADKEIYDVLAGVSNSIAVPSYENVCRENYTMIDVIYRDNQKIPLYVWHYLKSLKEANGTDVVVIGVNSAFSDFYKEKDLIFCTDICHKLDWLKSAQATFHYKTLGLIFCCDANEVKLSKRLEGIPMASSKPVNSGAQLLPLPLKRPKEEYDDFNEPIRMET
ncbi:uncharacterized protein LOC101893733 [Musca domestica]|uniref:Uncharacterized protein LOC101893733 n=1 Tax=Musca domestica TaxID=7370 RepID=A0A1I8NGJ7_MUSDO|nr:uncharacterized protein LOC101893733 [Musca domestica]